MVISDAAGVEGTRLPGTMPAARNHVGIQGNVDCELPMPGSARIQTSGA
jgi:hypothetical protein